MARSHFSSQALASIVISIAINMIGGNWPAWSITYIARLHRHTY